MLSDYHIHTYFSDDSQCPMEEIVQRAILMGLDIGEVKKILKDIGFKQFCTFERMQPIYWEL
ncbi:PHP domain-containing protein [Lacrimispora sphenoides]|uniref:Histidinol-phosphatase n=1 Tax=Lacrimispora sphenoides JCM 1415 TaxID=1297793 RepID=A0ABY1CI56_9FIRM|nr:PHP domain-containing protein [Lacrimispora sphenoides]SEU06293.1 hypothetical protein SAMN02745906_4537 [[Clostridium] sphenoides JCM 1415]SUY49104.1 HisJ family histidinol phosphate phosphatase [Lacrimispora sphenoides]